MMKTIILATLATMCALLRSATGAEPERPYPILGRPQIITDARFHSVITKLARDHRVEDVVYCIELVEYSFDPGASDEVQSLEMMIPALQILTDNFDSAIAPLVVFRLAKVRDPVLINRYHFLLNRLCKGDPANCFKDIRIEGIAAMIPPIAASTKLDRSAFFPPPGAAAASALDAALDRLKRKDSSARKGEPEQENGTANGR